MCRFSIILSKNENLSLKDIEDNLWFGSNSIFKQCYKDVYAPNDDNNIRNHKINLDGYGIGFYNHGIPKTYKNIYPSWNDSNLRNMVSIINTNLVMAHIRATNKCISFDDEKTFTSQINYPVHVYNCHPFTYKQWMFCHNGYIPEFDNGKSRKKIINRISDDLIVSITGNTDSEYIFYLIITFINEGFGVSNSIRETIKFINNLNADSTFSMNILLTNGSNIYATRYINHYDNHKPPSLYICNNNDHITISSEPLNKECPNSQIVDVNKLIEYDSDKQTVTICDL